MSERESTVAEAFELFQSNDEAVFYLLTLQRRVKPIQMVSTDHSKLLEGTVMDLTGGHGPMCLG